ncbi:MAG: hypothetical protein ACKV1O_00550 [Saprospiraceae bacterium]
MEILNAYTISIAIVVLLALVLIIVIASVSRKTSAVNIRQEASPEEKINNNVSNNISMAEIIKIRNTKGEEYAFKMARSMERSLMDRFAELDDYIEDDDEKINEITEKLKEFADYLEFCGNKAPSEKDAIKFMEFVNKTVENNKDSKFFFMYQYLYNLYLQLLDNTEVPKILKHIVNKDYFSEEEKFTGKQKNILLSSIDKLHEGVEESEGFVTKNTSLDIAKGIEKINKSILNIKIGLDNANNSSSLYFEVVFFKSILDKLHSKLKHFELERTENPVFNIQLFDNNPIKISNSKASVSFKLTNENHAKIQLNSIEIKPSTDSDDFRYENEVHTTIDLKSGSAIVPFVFNTYYFGGEEYDKNPMIEFKINYYLNRNKHHITTNPIKLPEVILEKKISNPFEEGESGRELSSTSGLFYGRTELLKQIASNLLTFSTDSKYYLLVGAPRSGKSSILNQLANNPKYLKEKFIPLKVSTDFYSTDEYFQALFEKIYKILDNNFDITLSKSEYEKLIKSRSLKVNIIKELLSIVEKDVVKSGKKILLLIDEYQNIAYRDEIDVSEKDAITQDFRYQMPGFLKSLRDEYSSIINVIVTGYQDFIKTSRYNKHWAELLGGRFKVEKVENFTESETFGFAEKSFSKEPFNFLFGESTKNLLWLYTSGHPFLLVKICSSLFKLLVKDDEIRELKQITPDDLNEAVNTLTFMDLKFVWNEQWLDDSINSRLILSYIGDQTYDNCFTNSVLTETITSFSVDKIKTYLREHYDITINDTSVFSAVDILKEYGLILFDQNKPGFIKLRYPLFAKFCKKSDLLNLTIQAYRNQ